MSWYTMKNFWIYLSRNQNTLWTNVILHLRLIFICKIIFRRLFFLAQSGISHVQVQLINFQIRFSPAELNGSIRSTLSIVVVASCNWITRRCEFARVESISRLLLLLRRAKISKEKESKILIRWLSIHWTVS